MTTWQDARHEMMRAIDKMEQVAQIARRAGAQMPPADPRLLRDSHADIRRLVASLLAINAVRNSSSQVMHEMLVGLSDADTEVRKQVAIAFGACGYAPAIDGLIRLLENPNTEERRAIGFYLCAIGEAAVPKLLACMTSQHIIASHEAASVLYNMGPDVVSWLLRELPHNTVEDWLLSLSVLTKYPEETQQGLQTLLETSTQASDSVLAAKILHVKSVFFKLLET